MSDMKNQSGRPGTQDPKHAGKTMEHGKEQDKQHTQSGSAPKQQGGQHGEHRDPNDHKGGQR